MNRKGQFFFWAVLVAAAALLLPLPWRAFWLSTPREILGLATFVGLAVLSEAMAIGFTFGASKSNASISFVPLLAAVVVFPPVFSGSAAAVTVFVAELFLRRRPAWLTAFNTGQYIIEGMEPRRSLTLLARDRRRRRH